jgi:uncharacterized hydrophobic protein (TIGR00271 family)
MATARPGSVRPDADATAVLQIRVYGTRSEMAEVAERLAALPGSRHVIRTPSDGTDASVVTADVGGRGAADTALATVRRLGVDDDNVELLRIDTIGTATSENPLGNVVWADVLGQAGTNARLIARYLIFMGIAGIIAAFGVIYSNGILIVGAMAVSPDILPVTATCAAIVLGRTVLARRSFATLVIGLALACAVAALMTAALDTLDLIPGDFTVDAAALHGLDAVDASTVIVALASGVAAILALETRATFAVGVAISVTTIPASAFLGVAAGVGQADDAAGALVVLAVNILMLIAGGSLTLIVQRRLGRRSLPEES